MGIKELKFKTRKYWLAINLLIVFFVIALMLILRKLGISPEFALIILIPLIWLGFDINMLVTRKEIEKMIIFILALVYIFVIWVMYDNNKNVLDIFALSTLKILFFTTILIIVPIFLFGYLPIMILRWGDRKYERNVYDTVQASYFIYRELPDEVAKKISDDDIMKILVMSFRLLFKKDKNNKYIKLDNEKEVRNKILKAYSNINESDLEEIFKLEEKYMEGIGIINKNN